MIDYSQFSYLAEPLIPKMLSYVVGLSVSSLLGLRPRSGLKTSALASKWPMAFQRFRSQLADAILTSTKRNQCLSFYTCLVLNNKFKKRAWQLS